MGPVMMSGQVTAKFLQFIISLVKAKNVLDIGMFTGYTALAMAEALPADGVVHTLDVCEYLKELTDGFFCQSPHGKKIKVHIAPGTDTMDKLSNEGIKFDVVFVDADKPGYRDYVDKIMDRDLLAPGGIILADNAFRHGEAYMAAETREDNPMNDFNSYIANKAELQQVLLPIRDGILAIKRKSEVDGRE